MGERKGHGPEQSAPAPEQWTEEMLDKKIKDYYEMYKQQIKNLQADLELAYEKADKESDLLEKEEIYKLIDRAEILLQNLRIRLNSVESQADWKDFHFSEDVEGSWSEKFALELAEIARLVKPYKKVYRSPEKAKENVKAAAKEMKHEAAEILTADTERLVREGRVSAVNILHSLKEHKFASEEDVAKLKELGEWLSSRGVLRALNGATSSLARKIGSFKLEIQQIEMVLAKLEADGETRSREWNEYQMSKTAKANNSWLGKLKDKFKKEKKEPEVILTSDARLKVILISVAAALALLVSPDNIREQVKEVIESPQIVEATKPTEVESPPENKEKFDLEKYSDQIKLDHPIHGVNLAVILRSEGPDFRMYLPVLGERPKDENLDEGVRYEEDGRRAFVYDAVRDYYRKNNLQLDEYFLPLAERAVAQMVGKNFDQKIVRNEKGQVRGVSIESNKGFRASLDVILKENLTKLRSKKIKSMPQTAHGIWPHLVLGQIGFSDDQINKVL